MHGAGEKLTRCQAGTCHFKSRQRLYRSLGQCPRTFLSSPLLPNPKHSSFPMSMPLPKATSAQVPLPVPRSGPVLLPHRPHHLRQRCMLGILSPMQSEGWGHHCVLSTHHTCGQLLTNEGRFLTGQEGSQSCLSEAQGS